VTILYRTTLVPSKLELLGEWLPTRSWYRLTGRAPRLASAGGFRLDDPEGEVGIEFLVVADSSGHAPTAYLVPMTYRGGALGGANEALIGTAEHGILGKRWIYDGTRDPVLVAALVALIQGEAAPQAIGESHTPDPTVCRKAAQAGSLAPVEFTPADGVTCTELSVGLAAPVPATAAQGGPLAAGPSPVPAAGSPWPGPGRLVVRVARILAPLPGGPAADGNPAGPDMDQGEHGYVTATWRPPGAADPVRSVFATAVTVSSDGA
jgi:hypothetical protein